MKYDLKKFDQALDDFKIVLNQKQRDQFIRFYEILLEWNSFMNLTAITEFDEVIEKHFVDSLSIVRVIQMENQKLIDLGTGAGFPGIPIKIAFPETSILLADSLNKRVKFLNHVICELDLKDVAAVHGRAEDLAKMKNHREQYDICVSRAVANLATLSEYCIPFVKQDGYFISYKSETGDKETNEAQSAIEQCGGILDRVDAFQLPGTEYNRKLICIHKIKKTDLKYPRKAGIPAKEPIGSFLK